MLPAVAGPRRTAIGGLVFGREDAKDFKLPAPAVAAPLDVKDTRQFLEAGLLYPKPLPWAPQAPGPQVTPNDDEASTPKNRYADVFSQNQPQLLAVRLAACERRLDSQEAEAAVLKRLESNFEQHREGVEVRNRVDIERTVKLETLVQQLQRDEASSRDKLTALQAEFRDFASQSLGRQRADHADIEGQVGQALARQNLSAEEWRTAMRHKDAQIQAEFERMFNSMEELREKMLSSQAELRVRLTSVEVPSNAQRGNDGVQSGLGAAEGTYLMQAMGFMKQQIEKLQSGSTQTGAGLSELQARLDGEAAARAAAQQDHQNRLEALNQALGASRALLAQSTSQRIEVLEERLGVERRDLMAKQERLREVVSLDGQEGSERMRELISRFRTEIENTERRCQMETARLREEMEGQLLQTREARFADEDARKASVAGLMQRVEGLADRQLDHTRASKQEVEASVRSVRDAVSAESNARQEAERHLLEQVSEAVQEALKDEKVAVQRSMKHQADLVAAEFEQMRRVNSDRADRLSRYVDHALAHAGLNMGINIKDGAGRADPDGIRSDVSDLKERVAAMRKEIEEQANSFQTRFEHFADDMKSKLQRAGDLQDKEAKVTRREAEKAAAAVEQRWLAGNEELKKRFEAYVTHFDSAINSVQAAILRPALRDPAVLGFLAGAAPQADAEATVSPRAVLDREAAATQPLAAQVRAGAIPEIMIQRPAQASQTLKVSPRQLLSHERVQQRQPLDTVEDFQTQASSPSDPMAVQELRATKSDLQEEMADEVVANLFGQSSEDSESQASHLDSARTLAPERS
mmetsp:Transcript_68993/g.122022  ORF Transcript_68993/g.122022 Transcript_68993/m.122022 type:complete len:811 (+) Transcript_68993:47-2479(+)